MPDSVPAPRQWTVNGRTYFVSRLTPAALGEMKQLIRDRVPNPYMEARKVIEGLPEGIAAHVWDSITRDLPAWPPSLTDPAGVEVMVSSDGMALTVFHACRRHTTNFTREQAAELADSLGEDDFQRLMNLIGPDDEGEDPFPKA